MEEKQPEAGIDPMVAGERLLRIDMIGPSYSGTLREMVREIKSIPENKGYVRDANQVDVRSMLEDLTIFSPFALVDGVAGFVGRRYR
ncbi:MAG: hypothetical protein ACYSWO_24570 [Planctomycetota bacterium]|jgi:hypothetical protein